MGCDGGTIPRRDELVRTKKKPEQKDKDAQREFLWLHCALSQQRLQEPIVMCGLGRLYSKQNVIEQLLEKKKMPDHMQHIRNMKDIKTLNLTPNPAYIEEDKSEGLLDTRPAPYICKLIGQEMSGKFRFVAFWSCGCVISERALRQIKRNGSGGSLCPLCQVPFRVEDIVLLNPGEEDVEMLQAKMEMREAKRKSCKKPKKEKEKKPETSTSENAAKVETEMKDEGQQPSSSNKVTNGPSSSKLKIVANLKRSGASEDALQDPEMKRLKSNYSVAKDPKATDVYKSLFTTHKSEKEQSRAHWVTYNPFYN